MCDWSDFTPISGAITPFIIGFLGPPCCFVLVFPHPSAKKMVQVVKLSELFDAIFQGEHET